MVTDANGNVYRQYYYDPYGNVIKVLDGSGNAVDINNDSGFNNAYTYRGYRYDSESGLYFLNARYYAAGIGRFLTKDTFKGVATYPGSLNRYAYCEGDPVNLVDYDGTRPDVTGGPEGAGTYRKATGKPYKPPTRVSVNSIDPKSPPPPESGYKPPKNPDKAKNKVEAPGAMGEHGWPDKKGNVWVPDVDMHGGEGWRRHYPDGSHDHVYPNGNVRTHNFTVGDVGTGVIVGVAAWEVVKWGAAAVGAPETFGASLGAAALMP